jgi:hypothetical protein
MKTIATVTAYKKGKFMTIEMEVEKPVNLAEIREEMLIAGWLPISVFNRYHQ